MVKAELNRRSPLRILEKSTHGGLGAGNLGVIASARGVGKTACLVHIATDQLFQGKHVIHVSFAGRIDHIVSWYETIFKEIAKKRSLESAVEIHDDLIKNRVIMNFSQDGISADQLRKSLKALISDGRFGAETVVIDGYDFTKGKPDFIASLRAFAQEEKISIWLTADAVPGEVDGRGIPQVLLPYIESIYVLITLSNAGEHITLKLVKDHEKYVGEDLQLRLDSKTLLIAESGDDD